MTDLTDEAKAEIAAAIAILKSDGLHIHKTAEQYAKSKETSEGKTDPGSEGTTDPKDNGEEGQPPPKKDDENEPPPKAGLWWGSRGNE